MRLVCPNCSAQYEIDGSMIPEEGRDVQCSNCGHTWFELPAPAAAMATGANKSTDHEVEDEFDHPPAYDLDDDDSFEDEGDAFPSSRKDSVPDFISREDFEDDSVRETSVFSEWDEAPDEPVEKEPEPEQPEDSGDDNDGDADTVIRAVTAATESDPDPENTEEVEADDTDTPQDPVVEEPAPDANDDSEDTALTAVAGGVAGAPRRPADAAALDILREEAERELSQRRAAPSEPLETQSDLGLDDIRNRRTPSRALRARMAHLGEDLPEEEPKVEFSEPAPAPRSTPRDDDGYEEPRRDLLPDIDEINSTLKSSGRGAEAAEAVQRSGFRYGFLLMLFLTIAAIFAYAQAPAIARALPQTESTIISYVDWANGLRDWVDGLISN